MRGKLLISQRAFKLMMEEVVPEWCCSDSHKEDFEGLLLVLPSLSCHYKKHGPLLRQNLKKNYSRARNCLLVNSVDISDVGCFIIPGRQRVRDRSCLCVLN